MRTAKLALQLFALFSGGLPPAAMAQGVFDGWRYTTEAVGAWDADRVGWIDQHAAATELFVAQGPDYRPQRVSASQANDGVPIEALSISADGRWLAAPLMVRRMAGGTLVFTPDASHAEMEPWVKGLNEAAKKNADAKSK